MGMHPLQAKDTTTLPPDAIRVTIKGRKGVKAKKQHEIAALAMAVPDFTKLYCIDHKVGWRPPLSPIPRFCDLHSLSPSHSTVFDIADIGGGKGHLARIVAQRTGLPVCSVDQDAALQVRKEVCNAEKHLLCQAIHCETI